MNNLITACQLKCLEYLKDYPEHIDLGEQAASEKLNLFMCCPNGIVREGERAYEFLKFYVTYTRYVPNIQIRSFVWTYETFQCLCENPYIEECIDTRQQLFNFNDVGLDAVGIEETMRRATEKVLLDFQALNSKNNYVSPILGLMSNK